MHFQRQTSTEVNAVSPEQPKKISIKTLHDQLGHMNETMCRKVAKALDWEVKKGSLAVCLSCSIAKAKQKNIKLIGKAMNQARWIESSVSGHRVNKTTKKHID
jgi:hypothetical protein